MILFNFKSWSGLKIALGVSIVLNVTLLCLWLYSVTLFGNEARKAEKLNVVFEQSLILEKCLKDLDVFELKSATDSSNYVKMDSLSICYNDWNSIFQE